MHKHYTKFGEGPLTFTQVIVRKRNYGRTDVWRTDGRQGQPMWYSATILWLGIKVWPFHKRVNPRSPLFFKLYLAHVPHAAIGPLVPEKIFAGFYLGFIWVWWPSWSCDQMRWRNFLSPTHWGSIWNLSLIGPVVSEKTFEECGWQITDGWRRKPVYTINSRMSLKA